MGRERAFAGGEGGDARGYQFNLDAVYSTIGDELRDR